MQLYFRYARRLFSLARAKSSPELARRIDAEELVQSIFGSFFRGVGSGYYDVVEGEELWKLLVVIALNKIRAKGNFHRAAKRDVRLTVSGELNEAALAASEDQDAAALAFLKLTVEEALEQLSPQHRQIVLLRIDGYDVAEMAEKSGRSKRTVERILQEARKKLAHLLEED
jgi:RNA polymerase sigma-70 factor (ECF subfamily)